MGVALMKKSTVGVVGAITVLMAAFGTGVARADDPHQRPLRILRPDLASAKLALRGRRLSRPLVHERHAATGAKSLVATVLGRALRTDERGRHHSTLSSTSSGEEDSIR